MITSTAIFSYTWEVWFGCEMAQMDKMVHSTAKFSVLVNGSLVGFFHNSLGLR